MEQDLLTQQQAQIVARQYNLAPDDPLKCERTIPDGTTRSLFLCNTSHTVKCLVQYNQDELEAPE